MYSIVNYAGLWVKMKDVDTNTLLEWVERITYLPRGKYLNYMDQLNCFRVQDLLYQVPDLYNYTETPNFHKHY